MSESRFRANDGIGAHFSLMAQPWTFWRLLYSGEKLCQDVKLRDDV